MGNKHSNIYRSKKSTSYPIPSTAVRPSPPGQPQVEIEDETSVYVEWDPPINNGGCPIIGFIVQYSEWNEKIWHTQNPPTIETHCWIINLYPGATYVFRVIAENILGYSGPSQISEQTLLSTEFSPPKFLQELESVNALRHEKVEFKARLAPGPPCKITWFMDNIEVFPEDLDTSHANVDIRGNSLVLGKVERDCEIKCLVESEYGAAESVAVLSVGVPPRIKEDPHAEYFFRVGEIIRIKFNFSGKPVPSVHWFHDAQPINQFQALSNTTVLKLPNASRHHQGEYTLKIENIHGQDSCFALVSVADKPSPPCKPTVNLMSDNSCLIEWNDGDDDGGCPVSSHIIEYFRSGWDVWLTGTSTRSKSARIRDLIPKSKYIFRVKAENQYGQSDPSKSSTQLFIPDHTSGLMTTVDEIEEEDGKPLEENRTSHSDNISSSVSNLSIIQNSFGTSNSSENDAISADYQYLNKPTTPEPQPYKPFALFDHYASARSLTLPYISANPTQRYYGSASSLSPNPYKQNQRKTDSPDNVKSGEGKFSNSSTRSQSSFDSIRSTSATSSTSHLIFEDMREGEIEPERITTSSLTLFKTGQSVRIRTTSSEQLATNSRGSSPLVPPIIQLHSTKVMSTNNEMLVESIPLKIPDENKDNNYLVGANDNKQNSAVVEDVINNGVRDIEQTLSSRIIDWLWILLFLAIFVKYVNIAASVILILYVFYCLCKISREYNINTNIFIINEKI